MNISSPFLVLAIAFASMAEPALAAATMPDHRPAGPGAAVDAMFEQLHLTPEQKKKIHDLRKQQMDASRDVRKKLEEKRRALFALIRRPDATKEQALALQKDIDDMQAQMSQARLNAWFEARAVLTPEQLDRLSKLKPPHGPRGPRGPRRGEGGSSPP